MRAGRILGGVILVAPLAIASALAAETLRPPATAPKAQPVAAETRLAIAEPGVEGSIVRLFRAAISRNPKGPELDSWVSRYRDGEPLDGIGDALAQTREFNATYGATTDPVYVERLYQNLFHRRANAEEVAHWTTELAAGRSRPAVLIAFAESDEFVTTTRTPPPTPPRPLVASPGVEHSVARIFLGLRGQWPPRDEFDEGVRRYLDGMPLTAIVDSVLTSPDVAPRYGATPNEVFVSKLYTDVLGRAATPDERQPWRERLDGGESRAVVVSAFTESDEMITRTRTAKPVPPPIPHMLLVVGDSVMRGAVGAIAAIPDWTVSVDARECRQVAIRVDGCGAVDIPSGIDALRAARRNGHLGGAVAIQIGNNGPITDDQFDALINEVADQRLVLFLTLKLPRAYAAGNNAVLARGVTRWPKARLVDWNGQGSRNPSWFSDGEGIHLSPAGAQAMADMIAAALPD